MLVCLCKRKTYEKARSIEHTPKDSGTRLRRRLQQQTLGHFPMTDAGYAQRGAQLQAKITQDAAESIGRRVTSSPDRSGSQSTDCAPSFSGRKVSQASDVASSDLLENVRLLAAGGIAGAVSKTVTAPLARLTILYQVRSRAPLVILSSLALVMPHADVRLLAGCLTSPSFRRSVHAVPLAAAWGVPCLMHLFTL